MKNLRKFSAQHGAWIVYVLALVAISSTYIFPAWMVAFVFMSMVFSFIVTSETARESISLSLRELDYIAAKEMAKEDMECVFYGIDDEDMP